MIQTIAWTGSAARLLDQTRLPTETVYIDATDERQMWDAIKRLVVRGAPLIGVSAAFGVYLGIRNAADDNLDVFLGHVKSVCDYLATSRPTAVNLFWALDRIHRVARQAAPSAKPATVEQCRAAIAAIKQRVLDECLAMIEEDRRVCRAIGEHGAALFSAPADRSTPLGILTHCNAGALAATAYGTALAPIYVAHERGMPLHVYSDETRPLLQGSRITAWELREHGVPVTTICDNMAATVMAEGKIQAAIVGADRITANGDTANKIGTMGVAILAKHFGIPFYVAAPLSTIDRKLTNGKQIPIEQRDAREITHGLGKQTTPDGIKIYNPAFDVTPAELISAIITERGVLQPPFARSIADAFKGQ